MRLRNTSPQARRAIVSLSSRGAAFVKSGVCHVLCNAFANGHMTRTCPIKKAEHRRSLPAEHPWNEKGQCPLGACVHNRDCKTLDFSSHLYETQTVNSVRWRINRKGRCVRKHIKKPPDEDDFVCTIISEALMSFFIANAQKVLWRQSRRSRRAPFPNAEHLGGHP